MDNDIITALCVFIFNPKNIPDSIAPLFLSILLNDFRV